MQALLGFLLPALAQAPPGSDAVVGPDLSELDYPALKAHLRQRRAELGAAWAAEQDPGARAAVRDAATQELLGALVTAFIPAWYGTPWDFNGISETPGEGSIACGYLVSTVMRDAGFRVERYKLAQQASEFIVKSLAPADEVADLAYPGRRGAVEHTARRGPGLYVVGLDYHVGLLVVDADSVDFCHSSYLEPAVVNCEPAGGSAAMLSSRYVIGKTLGEELVEGWLEGRDVVTRKP